MGMAATATATATATGGTQQLFRVEYQPHSNHVQMKNNNTISTSTNKEDDRIDSSSSSSRVRRRSSHSLPFPSLTKPSWIVTTESNVRKERRKKADPPCVVCHGTGRVHCHLCSGQGRTNCVHLTMLPKGEWPKWCRTCGGSGLSYCSRCLGTGEYRDIMGFHFMNTASNDPLHHNNRGSADQLLDG